MALIRKSSLNFFVDILSYISFIFLATTGLMMHYSLPSGTGHRYQIWGLDRHQWGDVHFWVSLIFLGTIILHLILHWKWIWIMIKGKGQQGWSPRAKAGIAAAIIVMIIFLIPLISPVQHDESRGYRVVRNEDSGWRQDLHSGENIPQRSEGTRRNNAPIKEQKRILEEEHHEEHIAGGNRGIVIMGSMSLQEVSDDSGVPVNHLIKKLNLPVNVSVYETLGRLRRSYGFQVQDVRDIVAEYK